MGQAVREFTKAKDEFEREVTRPPAPAPEPQVSPKLDQPSHSVAQDMGHDEHGDPSHATPQTPSTPETHVI
jgi:hypothetical protein